MLRKQYQAALTETRVEEPLVNNNTANGSDFPAGKSDYAGKPAVDRTHKKKNKKTRKTFVYEMALSPLNHVSFSIGDVSDATQQKGHKRK